MPGTDPHFVRAPRPAWVEAEYQRIGKERARACREADRAHRWAFIRTLAEIAGWSLAGLILAALAFHTTDPEIGMIYLDAAMCVTWGGVMTSLALAYRRGQERGDWQ